MDNKILVSINSYNNLESIKRAILEIQNFEKVDILIIDDGSDYNIFDEIEDYKFVKCVGHSEYSGYGSCLLTAYIFAKNLNYKYLITLNPNDPDSIKNIPDIINNLEYGYDIVSCSRILENSAYTKIDTDIITFYETLNSYLKEVTGLDITDPLSPDKGYNMDTIKDIEITDETHGALLQLFVQSSYFGYNIVEIPSESVISFGKELELYNDPLDTFLIIIETEKYLYNKGAIN